MRSGKLLAEESPQVLLSMYGCQSLEEVFLKLSRKQGSNCNVTELNISNNVSLVGSLSSHHLDVAPRPSVIHETPPLSVCVCTD
jgi:hypothetical protein